VIFLFINKHKELVKSFLDYTKIIEYKIFRDMPDYENEEINKLKENYENEFYENLGWTKSIIKEKNNRTLAYLAQDVGIDERMGVIYKLSSNYIHTNAYSAFMKNDINQNYVRIYLPFVADITIRQINMFIKVANKIDRQNEMLSVLLNRLGNILFPESIFAIKEKDKP
jgi:hypothetical protein